MMATLWSKIPKRSSESYFLVTPYTNRSCHNMSYNSYIRVSQLSKIAHVLTWLSFCFGALDLVVGSVGNLRRFASQTARMRYLINKRTKSNGPLDAADFGSSKFRAGEKYATQKPRSKPMHMKGRCCTAAWQSMQTQRSRPRWEVMAM